MTTEELWQFFAKIGLEEDACASLRRDYELLTENAVCAEILRANRELYGSGESAERDFPYGEAMKKLARAAEQIGVHPYAAEWLLFFDLAPQLQEIYEKKGLPDDFFTGAMQDLVCKAYECKSVYGIWGSFVAWWFVRFYRLSLYAIGRLEFCLIDCPADFEQNRSKIKKGQPCIDVHIPSRGRLTRELLDDAYARAKEFFAPYLEGPAVFHCESWLLADYHAEMLPENSGIRTFAGDYTLLAGAPDVDDLWRIFGSEDTSRPENLSEDTTLKRAYKERLLSGLPIYGGIGLFFFDEPADADRTKNKE